MQRFLSVWCPDWPIDRLRRARRAARTGSPAPPPPAAERPAPRPFALTETGARGVTLAAVNAPARAAGLAPGMTLTDARARLPELACEAIDRAADAAALEGLVRWLTRWTPRAALDGADGAMLEVTGCARLFGGESALLADLSRRLDAAGIVHRLGLAATPGAAWALAHTAGEQITRLDGAPEAGLAGLPVAGLRLSEETLALLRRFGLTRIGQLSGIDRRALARRFRSREAAEAVVLRLDQAFGRRAEPLDPLLPAPEHIERLPCPEPLIGLEGLQGALEALLPRLSAGLAAAGVGARRVVLTAYRADGTAGSVTVRAARPARDPAHFARLFRDRLETLDPGLGVDLVTLAAEATAPMETAPAPLSRDLAGAPVDAAALAALADRIGARLGPEAVGVLSPRASHIPERAEALERFEGALPDWSEDTAAPGPRPPRMLERPEPIEVVAGVPDGPPVRFVWRRVARQVVRAEGPERIAPEWWDLSERLPRARDYYRVEDASGLRYWLFREGLYGDGRGGAPRWFVHGLFA